MLSMLRANISGLDLNLLVVLDALLAEHSVSRAAQRLHSTQPTVSRALARLRTWFDDPLFVRVRHGLAPTARAEALRGALCTVLDELHRVAEPGNTFSARTSTRLFRVSTADYAQAVMFGALVRALAAEAPGIRLQVAPWVTANVVTELETGMTELAIGPSLGRPEPLRTRALLSDRFVVIARRDHPILAQRLTLARFASARYVQIAPDGRDGGVIDDALAARGISRRVVLRVPSFAVAPMIVASSDLFAVVPERLAATVIGGWPLAVRRPPIALPSFTLSMFWHARTDADPALGWLRLRLAALCGPLPARNSAPVARLRLDHRRRGTL